MIILPRQQSGSNAERLVSKLLVISGKLACHKRRKWGGGGGGGVTPNFSHCLHTELYYSIVVL